MTRPAVFKRAPGPHVSIFVLDTPDLSAANGVITRAVMGWRLAERVKRLALPLYRYDAADLAQLTLVGARDGEGRMVAVAAWEEASPADVPTGRRGLLLHGLYVDPPWQGRGVGRILLAAAVAAARERGLDGVLVKAQADAVGFFARQGCHELPLSDPARDYPHRFWCPV